MKVGGKRESKGQEEEEMENSFMSLCLLCGSLTLCPRPRGCRIGGVSIHTWFVSYQSVCLVLVVCVIAKRVFTAHAVLPWALWESLRRVPHLWDTVSSISLPPLHLEVTVHWVLARGMFSLRGLPAETVLMESSPSFLIGTLGEGLRSQGKATPHSRRGRGLWSAT